MSAPPNPALRAVDAQFLAVLDSPDGFPESDVPEVAFAGRSNVGKSSLLNSLLGRHRLVRTSSTPGCTRQINMFRARMGDGAIIHLVDLPGFGYAKRSKKERAEWGGRIEAYLTQRTSLCLVVVIVDVRRGLESEEELLFDYLASTRGAGFPAILVATKADKVPKAAAKRAVNELSRELARPIVLFSAKTGLGSDELWRRVRTEAFSRSTSTADRT